MSTASAKAKAERAADAAADVQLLAWLRQRVQAQASSSPCCAKCMRGTKALQGPCAYPTTCRCHTGIKPTDAEGARP